MAFIMNSLTIFSSVFIILCFTEKACTMTRPQLKKTMSVMKNQCMSKIGVSEDLISGIEQGQFPENHKVMCYISCVYKALNVVKDNKLNKDLIHRQVDILYPQELKEPTKNAVAQCMDLQNGYSDHCEGIFHSTKCLYEKDPPSFVFP